MRAAAIFLALSLCFLAACGAPAEINPSAPVSTGSVPIPEQPIVSSSVPVEESPVSSSEPELRQPESPTPEPVETGLFRELILDSAEGPVHYSYYLPESYDGATPLPMMVVMPGYDMMWFGEDSSGRNVNWNGFTAWTELPEDLIVVSAQLTDWGENSARQAVELTEYFLQNFAVDSGRVYAAGYSAGGETMSQAVAMRPDLYAAHLHGASQWDGDYAPLAKEGVAVCIFMAEHDEYYGSQKARDAHSSLTAAYREAGRSEEEIAALLRLEIPDDAWFADRGITGNYHAGGNIVFENENILGWIVSHQKS